MGSSPRFAFSNSALLKNGVLFQSAANNQAVAGPGHYSVPRNDFLKKSHNIRAQGNSSNYTLQGTKSLNNTPRTSPKASASNSSFQSGAEMKKQHQLNSFRTPPRASSFRSQSSAPVNSNISHSGGNNNYNHNQFRVQQHEDGNYDDDNNDDSQNSH